MVCALKPTPNQTSLGPVSLMVAIPVESSWFMSSVTFKSAKVFVPTIIVAAGSEVLPATAVVLNAVVGADVVGAVASGCIGAVGGGVAGSVDIGEVDGIVVELPGATGVVGIGVALVLVPIDVEGSDEIGIELVDAGSIGSAVVGAVCVGKVDRSKLIPPSSVARWVPEPKLDRGSPMAAIRLRFEASGLKE